MRLPGLCSLMILWAIAAPALAADAEQGKKLFQPCARCHSTVADSASQLLGPPLNGVVGRKAASVEDYRYSSAMRASGITWTEQDLKEYIANPQAKVKGTRKVLTSTLAPDQIDDIVAYLKTLK